MTLFSCDEANFNRLEVRLFARPLMKGQMNGSHGLLISGMSRP